MNIFNHLKIKKILKMIIFVNYFFYRIDIFFLTLFEGRKK